MGSIIKRSRPANDVQAHAQQRMSRRSFAMRLGLRKRRKAV